MKIEIMDQIPGEEDRVTFHIKYMTENIARAVNILKSPDSVPVYIDGQALLLPADDIFYVESVDLKTFVYTEKSVYQSRLRLYEFDEILSKGDFLRISKQVIVNIRKITGVSPAGDSRFLAVLTNGEKIIISRQYVPSLKERFGL